MVLIREHRKNKNTEIAYHVQGQRMLKFWEVIWEKFVGIWNKHENRNSRSDPPDVPESSVQN